MFLMYIYIIYIMIIEYKFLSKDGGGAYILSSSSLLLLRLLVAALVDLDLAAAHAVCLSLFAAERAGAVGVVLLEAHIAADGRVRAVLSVRVRGVKGHH